MFGKEIISVLIRVLEVIFAVGVIGSAVVTLLVGVEDFREVFKPDKDAAD